MPDGATAIGLFIILLMSFAINFREAETASEIEEAKSRELQEQQEQTVQRLTDNQETLEHILRSIEHSLEAQGIRVQVFPRTGVLRLPEEILFGSGRADLSQQGQRAVSIVARALTGILPCHADMPTLTPVSCDPERHGRLEALLIEGHTDDVPLRAGSRFQTNWELSAARAIATFNALTDHSLVELARNDRGETLIGVSGYGEERPVASNETEQGRRVNRRIDLRFLMATPERPDAPPPNLTP